MPTKIGAEPPAGYAQTWIASTPVSANAVPSLNAFSSNAHPPIASGSRCTAVDANSTFMRGTVCSNPIRCRPRSIPPRAGTVVEATVNVRVAGPEPESGDATERPENPAGLMVQAHPGGAGIVSVPDPPAAPKTVAVALASKAHGSVMTAPSTRFASGGETAVADAPLAAIRSSELAVIA